MLKNIAIEGVIEIIDRTRGKKIVVFGTGEMAKAVISFLPVTVSYFVDNNREKQSKKYFGKRIFSPDELKKENKEDVVVLIASMYYKDISFQLEGLGFAENFSFVNTKPLYEMIIDFNNDAVHDMIKEYLKEYTSKKINISEYKRILVAKEINWLGLSNERLFFLGLKRGYNILFTDDEVIYEKDYFFDISNDYKDITFKGVNLFQAGLYNICFDLKVSVKNIDLNVELHKKTILLWLNRCANFISKVLPIFEVRSVSKVVIFQGHFYKQAILRQLAILYNIEVLCLENTFNKNKAVWDSVSALTVNNNSARNYYWRYRDVLDIKKAEEYTLNYINKVKEQKMPEHDTPMKRYEKISNRKTILFIGQVYLDSSTLLGIWDYKDPIEIILSLVNYCMENNMHLIIKLHPKERSSEHFYNDTLKHIESNAELASKIRGSDSILLDDENEYDTYSLIDAADVCVTINSQAGVEALIKGKDVILCGMSSYGGMGFTYEAYNKEMLKHSLDMKLKDNISLIKNDDISKFFYIYNELYCIRKDEVSVLDKIVEGV